MIRAIIFDFDGLLIDTEGPDYDAWQQIYQEYGAHLELALWAQCIGRSADFFDPIADLERRVGRTLDRESLLDRQRAAHRTLIERQPLLPGVRDWIVRAGDLGLKVGIASSSTRDWVTGHLERLGMMDAWDCIRCWGDVERAKPDPDLYLAVMDSLGVSPEETIALEDSPNGIMAARRAGIFCVAVPNPLTAALDLSGADLVVPSLAEVTLDEVLERVKEVRSAGQRPSHA